jgi:4-hydroxythreonine-4-phosphate dehydrogenase
MAMALPRVAIATGDPAGIGPEISLKAALDPRVRAICRPILVGDRTAIETHARACGLKPDFRFVDKVADARWSDGTVNVLECPSLDGKLELGVADARYGRAALASARRAIHAALAGEVEAVVAAPQTEKSIAMAGIHFDGYPSFVARETGLAENDVFLMHCFDDTRIVHCTLHCSVREAVEMITHERVLRVIRATDEALKKLAAPSRRIYVSGLNPHAGEDGLFGREEIEIIAPAIADAKNLGIEVEGPFGADTMFHKKDCGAFIVMLHDQGHITSKLLAFARTAGLSIGSPILFSSVAHGSAFDIAGKNLAKPAAVIEAISRLAKVGCAKAAA